MSRNLHGWDLGNPLEKRDSAADLSAIDMEWMPRPNSIFGTIGNSILPFGTSADFIPADGNGHVIDIRGTGTTGEAQWLGLNSVMMQHYAYIYCSPLASVIDKLAEADTNGRIRIVDEAGNPVENISKKPALKRIMKLFTDPNPLQTFEEFNSEQIVLCKKYGYCPVFALCPDGFEKNYTIAFFNLNPYFWSPVMAYEYDIFDTESKAIKAWTCTMGGKTVTVDSKDVILLKDGFIGQSDNPHLPISKIAGLDFFISNICAAMEADNVLLKKKGPLGIFSHDPKPDMAGWEPMTNSEKDEVQNELKRYGMTIGQLQYIISRTPIKWNAMSFNVRDLMTKETIRQSIDSICDRFGFPAELMSGKNATYENRNSAEKFLYNNNIIPFSLRRMARYSRFFNLDDYDVKLELDYSHLAVMQEDVEKEARADYARSQSLDLDWKNGMITYDEYRLAQGYEKDTKGNGELTYPEWVAKHGENLAKLNGNDNKANTGADPEAKEKSSSD